jgi:acetyl-CoA carboxylase carboxyl transferase subunit beta
MSWSEIKKAPLSKGERLDTPDGLWLRCHSCQEIIYRKDFEANQHVCLRCQHHFAISPKERCLHFLDIESLQICDENLTSTDPLKFKAKKEYSSQLAEQFKTHKKRDAIVCGEGLLKGRPVQVGVFDFGFMGGSMGCVVGEKIKRVFLRAKEKRQAAIIFSSSGGARMQEGVLSLMQMAKTCAALSQLREAGIPMISVLTDPTTGGVAASYALLGDVNIGEPGALIGFAGPRVIQQTMRQNLPEGFQTSEYLLQHGMLDLICPRNDLRNQIAQILDILFPVS